MKKRVSIIILLGFIALGLSGCGDTIESLKKERAELKVKCEKEAKELKEKQDAEGFEELMKKCERKDKVLRTKLKELKAK